MQGQNSCALETARVGFLVPIFPCFLFSVCFCGLGVWWGFLSLVVLNPFLGTFWLPDQFCHQSAIINKKAGNGCQKGTCWVQIQELDVKGFEIVTNQRCLGVLNQPWSGWELADS